MATLTTLVDGQVAVVAPVNANFAALNTEIAGALRTGYSSGTDISNIGAGEDTLHTWTMPASTIVDAGDGLLLKSYGQFGANANTKTLKFYLGSTAITLNPATTAPNNLIFRVEVEVIFIGGTSYNIVRRIAYSDGTSEQTYTNPSGEDPTTALIVKFTGTATTTADIVQSGLQIFIFGAP